MVYSCHPPIHRCHQERGQTHHRRGRRGAHRVAHRLGGDLGAHLPADPQDPSGRAAHRISRLAHRQAPRRAALAGVDGDFGAHSLRSGFVTEAGRQSVPLKARWRIPATGAWRRFCAITSRGPSRRVRPPISWPLCRRNTAPQRPRKMAGIALCETAPPIRGKIDAEGCPR